MAHLELCAGPAVTAGPRVGPLNTPAEQCKPHATHLQLHGEAAVKTGPRVARVDDGSGLWVSAGNKGDTFHMSVFIDLRDEIQGMKA